jgi:hypothetical protein
MSHHHNHKHHHHHDHDHDHHETKSTLSLDEKLIKLLEHWIKHNESHVETYRDWAQKAKADNMDKVSALIEEAADLTGPINKKFEEAAKLMQAK